MRVKGIIRKGVAGTRFHLMAIPVLILGLTLNSCDPESFNLSCENCYTIKPTEGILSIELGPYREGDSIPVKVYKGKLESGKIFLEDTITRNSLDIWVPVGFFSTVVAE